MDQTRYLIIGGGITGTTAASTIRKHDTGARLIVLEDEAHQLYSRVALPAFTRSKTTEDRVFLKDHTFYSDHRIELWSGVRAVGLDSEARIVTLMDGRRVHYEKLLIATGSKPRQWDVPGDDKTGVLSLRTIEDAKHITARLQGSKHVVVVGGGFITLEMIQTIAQVGVTATIVIREPYYWASQLDHEGGELIQTLIEQPNIHFLFNTEILDVQGNDTVTGVLLSNGKTLTTDTVLVNIGTDPDLTWLDGAGLHLGRGVQTDEFFRTSVPTIFAAGDVAEFYDPTLKIRHVLGNWSNAVAQGQAVGESMVEKGEPFSTLSTYSISVFGKNVSFLGHTLATSRMQAIPRGSARDGSYTRIILDKGRVVGAILINRFAERTAMEKLIRAGVDVRPYLAELADTTHSLKDISDHILRRHTLSQ
jgi:3-phenylpropionate/trans-cinnamate dioxygenase ferredoxin reductase subunit